MNIVILFTHFLFLVDGNYKNIYYECNKGRTLVIDTLNNRGISGTDSLKQLGLGSCKCGRILCQRHKCGSDARFDDCANGEEHLQAQNKSYCYEHIREIAIIVERRVFISQIQIAGQARQDTGHDRAHGPHISNKIVVDQLDNAAVLQNSPRVPRCGDKRLSVDGYL